MDLILILLLIVAIGLGAMTFLQFKKTKTPSQQPYQIQNNPNFQQQLARVEQKFQQNPPQQNQQLWDFKGQPINKIANKNYRQIYSEIAKEMAKKKVKKKIQTKKHIAETIMAFQLEGKNPSHYSMTTDQNNPDDMPIFAISQTGRPTQKVEPNPTLDKMAYWQNNQNRLMLVGGIASFVLLLIMAI